MDNQLPRFPEPFWRKNVSAELEFPKLSEDLTCDVCIVGGGIAGITTAYVLQKEGFDVVVLEAGRLLNGTTGHTTAKITSQHGLIYDEYISHFGEEKARRYYEANEEGLKMIESFISELGVDCGFSRQDAFVWTNERKKLDQLKKEDEAYRKLGIDGGLVDESELPFPAEGAIVIRNQAQFNPVPYLQAMAASFTDKGGRIFENTTANGVDPGDSPKVNTRSGYSVTCRHVVAASHFPFYDGSALFFARMHAERSYSLAVRTSKPMETGMYINAEDPKRSIRSSPMGDETIMIIGGERHKTGQGIDTSRHYDDLAFYSREVFPDAEVLYRWASHDWITMDKMPYIGPVREKYGNILAATGFHKWGMTNGTIAARVIRDAIQENEHPYRELYSPQRLKADPSFREFVKENANVAKELIKGKIELNGRDPEDLQNDQGGVVRVNGKRAGAYRDHDGKLHIVDTTCRHMGCEVEWNDGDRTWDCPCHASRYKVDGTVVEGPATEPLKRIEP
ncbi:FAD-dependent oxidoreductase [Alteribacter natronophilus]|uniref:FAD-dependent oxidoreductase n=1 Tax=Alteribacter natronophilus TaxID=2583810 RepID=UPI00110D6F32|nr:FAD-dependent oxidoreductase [Alteribacter natronophilus]TMW72074.1 FAD-dependent oxidoreductase [Alteribacter natronophilus]